MVSVDMLVAYAQELEDAAEGSGLAWLQARRDEALARINGGGSADYISSTVNGQTFMGRITSTSEDWFDLTQLAILQITGKATKVTYAISPTPPH